MGFHNRLLSHARLREILLASSALVAVATPAAAQDASWLNTATVAGPVPGTFDYNATSNWSPAVVPTGTAFFGASTTAALSFSADATIGGWTFNSGASNYTFFNTANYAFTGAGIAINGGTALINNIGTGLSFLNASTAGNATIHSQATLNFKDASTAGNATIINDLPAINVFFKDTSTAGNATITTAGNVFFMNTATAGNAVINDNGTVEFSSASTAGNATFNNLASLNFRNTSTASNATINNSGVLDFFDASTAANATITTDNVFSSITFHTTSTAGNATIINNHNLSFRDNSTAGSATIFNNASLLFDFSSTAGNATIVTNGASSHTLLIGNSSGAAARFILNGGGTLDFSNHLGGATVGSIEGNGDIFLSGFLDVVARNVTVGGNDLSTTFSGVIRDGGTGSSLTKVGTGTLTLSGNNTYTGATTINGGKLQVDGSIAASSGVAVNNSATLGGSGTVGATTINAGGILAPGAGSATTNLAISGNLAFQSGALYLVQLNAAGQSSKAVVAGNAALGGASVQAVLAPGTYTKGQSFIILSSANPISGTFAGVSLNNFTGTLNYSDPTKVNLTITGATLGTAANLNANQQQVADLINNVFNNGGALPTSFSTLLGLSGPNLRAALTQISGETAVGSQQTTFNAMNQFMGVLTDPFIDGRGGNAAVGARANGYVDDQALGYAQRRNPNDALGAIYTKTRPVPFEQRWSVWASGFGGSQTTDGNRVLGSNDTTGRIFGTAVGADYLFSPDTIAGFALAGGGTNFSVANGGTGRSDLFQAGAFVSHHAGAAYVTAALAYGWQDVTTDRTLTVAGIDHLRAEFNANAWSGRVEGGYRFVAPIIGGLGLTPYAAAQLTVFNLPSYAESVVSGADTFALAYSSKTVTAPRSEFGFRTDKSFALADSILTLRGRAAWAHDFDTNRAIAATFQTLPGASFVVNGAAPAADAALVTASAERKWLNGFSLAATFEGEFSEVTRSYAGKGVVRYQW